MTDTEILRKALERYRNATHENAAFKDDKLEGMAAFVVPLTGMMFADKMEEKLFGKEEG